VIRRGVRQQRRDDLFFELLKALEDEIRKDLFKLAGEADTPFPSVEIARRLENDPVPFKMVEAGYDGPLGEADVVDDFRRRR